MKKPGRRSFRPGPLQYLSLLSIWLVFIAIGLATITYGLATPGGDLGRRAAAGLFWIVLGALPCAYVLGLSVEANDKHVSKKFLFGLYRETIPLDRLAAKVDNEFASGVFVSKAQFMSSQGKGAFGLYRTWVWRSRDVDELLRLARRRWDPEASMRRQNGLMITIVVLLGMAALVVFLIALGKAGPNSSILGIPMR